MLKPSGNSSKIVSLAFWLDLRSYGAMLNKAGFDPTCSEAKAAIERLQCFQEVVARHSRVSFPTLVVNDGAVSYRDARLTVANRVWPFVKRCWDLYQAAAQADRKLSDCGLRGVVAAGLRARGSNRGILAQNDAMEKIVTALAEGRITKEEALKACWRVRRVSDIVPQLQANFAFSRAYTAEQGASEGKLEGSRFYLETRVLRDGVPDWMTAGEPINWRPKVPWLSNLSSSFVEVEAMDALATDQESAFCTGREMLPSLRHRRGD